MACLNPISIANPNLGKCPTLHLNTKSKFILVPCGKCPACLSQKRLDMVNRLKLEASASDFNIFFTLTYDELNVPRYSEVYPDDELARLLPDLQVVDKRSVQLFLQRIRNSFRPLHETTQLRYAICSEYGPTTLRPHYHGILFGLPARWNPDVEIQNAWPFGFTSCGPLLDGGSGYVGKYLFKKSDVPSESDDFRGKNFFLSSRKPPIGTYGLTHKIIEYINEHGTRRVKIKHFGEIVVPYVLLSQFLTTRQIQRLRAIEHVKSTGYNDNRLSALVAREGSLKAALRQDTISKEAKWIELTNNINRSKKQSKDL